jgi:hypothetical protein
MTAATTKKRTYWDSDRIRQAQLRARRKEQGWKRVSIWLSPEQVNNLETLGGESWLGRTVKELLTGAVSERQKPAKQAALFVVPDMVSDTEPDSGQPDKAALYREAEQLQTQGLSWADIARRWNEQGWRTSKGAYFRGWNLQRDVQRWKKGAAE